MKKVYPEATFTIYERQTDFGPVNYFTDGRTCWVKTGLTINGLEHIEELPVMNFSNKAIPLDAVTSTDVNKAIQRSLTKAAARHGLGLYIYAGEDLPEAEQSNEEKPKGKVQGFLEANTKLMMQAFNIPDEEEMKRKITQWWNELVADGKIKKIKFSEMDLDQAEEFVDAIYTYYRPSGEKK